MMLHKKIKNEIVTNLTILFFSRHFNLYYLPLLLLLYLFLFSISNYSTVFIILKVFSSLLLFPFWKDLKKEFHPEYFTRFLRNSLLIILYFLITIYYSENPQFGFTKLFIVIISYLPIILVTFLVIKSTGRREFFIYSLIALASIGSIFAILLSPFEYGTLYSFSFFRWSHVVFSRFICLALLFNFYLILNTKRSDLLLNITLQIILFGLLFSGARGTVAVAILCPLLLVLLSKSLFYNKILIIVHVIFALIIFIIFGPTLQQNRLLNSGEIILGKSEIDGSISNRISAFEISVERWQKHPIGGLGLGGFNTFYKSDLPQKMVYPHNLLLEILVEFGLVGMFLFLTFLFSLITNLWKTRFELTILFLYAFGLALFSKDLASNPMLFAFIAIYFFKPPDTVS